MFKSDEEVETLLNHPNNGIIKHSFIGRGNNPSSIGHGNGSGSRLSIQDKADIATLALLVGNKTAAELTGEHPAHVSQIKNGKDGLGRPESGTRAATDRRIGIIKESALDKVDLLLGIISEDKISDGTIGVKDAASTAEKLVNIFDKLGPKTPNIERANIVFYSPKVREAASYPIIDVEPAPN
jgi:hypothetical protein